MIIKMESLFASFSSDKTGVIDWYTNRIDGNTVIKIMQTAKHINLGQVL